jgi:sugar-specific transcriptional regulator TrmB
MPIQPYENQIIKLGLSDKEAKVYLASLELGPASVQKISQKANVKRATTYVAIDALIQRGLMSFFVRDKKKLFSAESPQMLAVFLEDEKKNLIDRQEIIAEILPGLEILSKISGDRPSISFFEGFEGLRTIQEDIIRSRVSKLDNIVSLDDALKIGQNQDCVSSFRKRLITKGINVRILYSSEKRELELPLQAQRMWFAKRLPKDVMPLHGELTLYGHKVAVFSYRGKIFGAVIESEEIGNTLRVLFDLAWSSSNF